MSLTPEQVSSAFNSALAAMRDYIDKPPAVRDDGTIMRPEPWAGYGRACEERRSLLPHIYSSAYPERIMSMRAPNQTDAESQYMRRNYRAITLPVYTDFHNTILRALNDGNWALNYSTIEDAAKREGVRKYVESGIPVVGSVSGYIQYVLPKVKTSDAMGLLVMMPDIPMVVNEEGITVVDPEGIVMAYPQYVPVDNVWARADGEWYMFLTDERSVVVGPGGKDERTGLVLVAVDEQWYWRIEQVGKKSDMAFNIAPWFEHETGMVPAMPLMGQPVMEGMRLHWQSHYEEVRPLLDQALLDSSYLGVSKATGNFPYRIQVGDRCDHITPSGHQCAGTGKIIIYEGEGHTPTSVYTCPGCGGSGAKGRLSPMGLMLIDPNDAAFQSSGIKPADAIHWSSPDSTPLEFSRREIRQHLQEARRMMHLSSESPMAGGEAKTATESGLDNRAMMAFIKPIADQYFDLMEFVIGFATRIMHGADAQVPELARPYSYEVRTEADILAELRTAYDANLPMPVIERIMRSYFTARYANDSGMIRAIDVIAAADDLFAMSLPMIQYNVAQRVVEPWEVTLHFRSLAIYDMLLQEGLIGADMTANREAMHAKAKELTPSGDAAGGRMAELIRSIGRPA